MALTSRYINKLSGYLSIIKPIVYCPQVITTPNQREQNYRFIFAQSNTLEDTGLKGTNTKDYTLADNRELSNDIVTKVKVSNMTSIDKIQKDSICLSCSKNPENNTPTGRPSPEALTQTYTVLSDYLPNFFTHPFNYSIYHKDIIFEDNIRNIRTHGILGYAKQMQLIKILAHIRFAYVKLEILKITKHPEDGTIKVRWKITGISGLNVLFQFWKYKLWNYRDIINKPEIWYDGFSTFYLNSEGQVVKHVADKMMPDSDTMTTETSANLGAAKLAVALGLIPKIYDVSSTCPLSL